MAACLCSIGLQPTVSRVSGRAVDTGCSASCSSSGRRLGGSRQASAGSGRLSATIPWLSLFLSNGRHARCQDLGSDCTCAASAQQGLCPAVSVVELVTAAALLSPRATERREQFLTSGRDGREERNNMVSIILIQDRGLQIRQRFALIQEACMGSTHLSTLLHVGRSADSWPLQSTRPPCTMPAHCRLEKAWCGRLLGGVDQSARRNAAELSSCGYRLKAALRHTMSQQHFYIFCPLAHGRFMPLSYSGQGSLVADGNACGNIWYVLLDD